MLVSTPSVVLGKKVKWFNMWLGNKISAAVLGWIMSLQNSCLPGTCKRDLGNRVFVGIIQLRQGQSGSGWTLTRWLLCLQEGNFDTGANGGKMARRRQRQRLESSTTSHEPRGVKATLGKQQRQKILSQSLWSSADLLTPWFQSCSFQGCERINSYCFKLSSSW